MLCGLLYNRTDSAGLFIAMCLAYLVFYYAKREKKPIKEIGYVISAVVIVLSTLMILGKIAERIRSIKEGLYARAACCNKQMPPQQMMPPMPGMPTQQQQPPQR